MTRNPQGQGKWFASALLFLTVVLCVPGSGAGAVGKRGKTDADESEGEDFTKPQLLNADTDPTLRYSAAGLSGWSVFSTSYGWFDVTRQTVRYTVIEPKGKTGESFEAQMSEISEVKLNSAYLTFRDGKKKRTVFFIAQSRWGSIHSGPGVMAAAAQGALGTGSMLQALKNFDRVLASVKPAPAAVQPPAPPRAEPKPEPPPAPPALALMSPPGAGSNKVIDVTASTLVVRGMAMDNTGIPVVTINDSPANMRPQSAQSTEFWSEPIQLRAGDNPVQIIASNRAHAETKLTFTVRYTPPAAPVNPHALDKAGILGLLNGGVSSSRVAELVKDRGIKFTPTADDLAQIRAAGGSDEVIQAIQEAAPAK